MNSGTNAMATITQDARGAPTQKPTKSGGLFRLDRHARATVVADVKAMTRSNSLISWMAPHSGQAALRTPSSCYGVAAAGTHMETPRRSISAARSRSASGTVAAMARGSPFRSNPGQVEGQINRLKMIKRQMYGRAGFHLLRARVLPYTPAISAGPAP